MTLQVCLPRWIIRKVNQESVQLKTKTSLKLKVHWSWWKRKVFLLFNETISKRDYELETTLCPLMLAASYLNQILPFSRLQQRRPIFCPKGEMKLKLIKSNFDSRLQVSKMLFVLLSVLQFFLFCFSFLGHLMSSSESCIDTYQLLVNCITALVIFSRNQFVLQINVACDNVVFQHCSSTWLFLNRKRRCNKYEIHSRKGSSNRNNEEDKTNVSMLTVSRKELCEKPGKFLFCRVYSTASNFLDFLLLLCSKSFAKWDENHSAFA